jgi:HK97 family phage prohead protease
MRFYWPIAKVDHEQRMVWGYASTESEDDQGEIVRREALAAALDDYMRFANIREMHQPSAVGVAKEANLDDRGLYLAAKIVDDDAWAKVVEGVYKGFSIGGRVTARDPRDRNIITGVSLTEISVVDRPANPEAVFDCWKAAAAARRDPPAGSPEYRPGDSMDDATARRFPVQIWHCGIADHQHVAKAEALRCLGRRGEAPRADAPDAERDPDGAVPYADPGYCEDGRKRYPIDSEPHIRAAWAYIHQRDNAARYTEGQLARIKERIITAWQQEIGPDGPPAATGAGNQSEQSDRLRAALAELCGFIEGAIAEGGAARLPAAAELAAMSIADGLRKTPGPDIAPVVEGLAKLAGAILPRLEALQQRVEEIARTPLPPATIARGVAGIAKRDDGAGPVAAPEDVVAALARMSDEERTLALIKAAHANPIRVTGFTR